MASTEEKDTSQRHPSLASLAALPSSSSKPPQSQPISNLEDHGSTNLSSNIFPATPQVGICIDPIALVTQECITVTSAMRKHARWAQSSVSAILGGGGSKQEKDYEKTFPGKTTSSRAPAAPRIDPSGGKGRLGSVSASAGSDDGEDGSSLASRWGLRGKKGKSVQDNPLLSAFAKLRRDVAGCRDIGTVDTPMLLHPFLQVIRSSSTSAAITSLAVISITKFFSYNLINVQSPRIQLAMHLLSAAITHCRFEASDTAADEVVLLRILRLMELIICRPEGALLGDESICEMMSTGLSMCCQARLSEVLRRSAEMAMVTMCQIVFGRLTELEAEEAPHPASTVRSRSNTLKSTAIATNTGPEEMKISPPMDGSVMANGAALRSSMDERASYDAAPVPEKSTEEISNDTTQPNVEEGEEEPLRPYALPSIRELFRVLIDLLDPHNKSHTDTMRIMAMRIIDVALEVAGPSIAVQPSMAVLVEDDLCRYLFQLVRSENMVLLNSSLRVAGTLLATCRKLLKLQQELFLSYLVACLHPKVDIPAEPGIDPALYEGVPQAPKLVKPAPSQPSSGRSTPVPIKDRRQLGLEGGTRRPEAREAMVESIGTLVRMPSFMAELFVNYDCQVDRQDLCEDMVGLLSRNAFPDAATWSTTNVPPLCLDSLLTFIQFMAERADQPLTADSGERIRELRKQRVRKKIIKSGSIKFNDDPKAGVAFLVKNGIIGNPDDPIQVATFLKSTSHVSKKVLGDFISKKSNSELLKAFIELFDFDNKRIDEALRELLMSFRLPGESQLIERIVEVFVEKWFSSSISEDVADKESGFVLTYAIIMLNTDLYNPNVRGQKRMTYEDFARNLRGCNGKKDFDPEYLQDIYDAIKENEIILPDEHDNKNAFEHAWKTLLMTTHQAGKLELCDTNMYDAEMFRATWKPVVATLCYIFMSATDDAVFSRILVGFDQCALIAATYGVQEALDRIVFSLSQVSSLATEIPPSTSLNTEVQVGKRRIMVSELAVRLGRGFRAQLATVLLFRILKGRESAIGDTWVYLVRIFRNLFVNSLIVFPPIASGRLSELGPIPLQPPSLVIDRDGKLAETGLFSTFTSYLSSYAADDPPEPSEEEVENTLSTVDCIKACKVEEVLSNILALPVPQLEMLVNALLSELPESPSPVVVVKPDVRPAPVTARMNGTRNAKNGPEYLPGNVFLLDLATRLALRDESTLSKTGESVTGVLQTAVRDAENMHPVAASRIIQYLLDMLRLSFSYEFMRAPVVLHAISSFNDPTLDQTAPAVVKGFNACVEEGGPLRNDVTASPDFWAVLQRLHQHKTEAEGVFEILTNITTSEPPGITADNYEAAISLANDFAAAAGQIGAEHEQRRDMAARRGQKVKPPSSADTAIIQRGLKAITIVYAVSGLASGLIKQSHLESRNEAWAYYWSPIFRMLSIQSVNACREIRYRALAALQRVLLSEDLAKDSQALDSKENEPGQDAGVDTRRDAEWTAVFSEVLFPLTLKVLKPEVHQTDPLGMSETRVQLATLLCKIFLRYLDELRVKCGLGKVLEIWTKTLELLDRMVNSGMDIVDRRASRDSRDGGETPLVEAVREGVKNCLLVMAGSGYLVAPGEQGKSEDEDETKNKQQMWEQTGTRLERFLPGLMEELFPVAEPKTTDASVIEDGTSQQEQK